MPARRRFHGQEQTVWPQAHLAPAPVIVHVVAIAPTIRDVPVVAQRFVLEAFDEGFAYLGKLGACGWCGRSA